jgi:prolyl-tRNA synthetase
LKGVPVRIAVGPKDLENGTLVARRDTLTKESPKMGLHILKVFRKIQLDLFTKALDYRNILQK